ncbi:MAG: asparaginase [Gemmatimonadota bacterium]|nr:asparaginase [Gemmatimonadota bacterium]
MRLLCPNPSAIHRLCLLACLVHIAPVLSAQSPRPAVHVVATGGTISNLGNGARRSGEELIRGIPGLDTTFSVTVEQFSNVASGSITPEHWITLARRINELFQTRPDLRGVVVTHGTDTIEETAFFLDLTVGSCRPVVVTGAMRRAADVGAEGPANLYNSIRLAAAPGARGRGTMVLLNDEIHAARFVTKANTSRLDAFASPDAGPLGVTDPDTVVFHHPPSRACPSRGVEAPTYDLRSVGALPRVDIVYSYIGADSMTVEALVNAGARGLVLASVGRGGTPPGQGAALRRAVDRGIFVLVSSRTGSGRVPFREREGMEGWRPGRGAAFGADDLNPQKARILLMLALARTQDPREIARYFRRP